MTHSTSTYQALPEGLIAKAEYEDFAPAPCVCYGCLIPDAQKKRTFFHAYQNRMVINYPISPCFCLCNDEKCMFDQVYTYFYDKQPTRVGMCCYCIPCTCCGPPVIYSFNPACLCIDLKCCFGSQIKHAPCRCGNCKICCCCGNPCYECCGIPLVTGVKNPDTFLAAMAGALVTYGQQRGISKDELAVFASVSDNIDVFGGKKDIAPQTMQTEMVRE